MYIYIYREREREREAGRQAGNLRSHFGSRGTVVPLEAKLSPFVLEVFFALAQDRRRAGAIATEVWSSHLVRRGKMPHTIVQTTNEFPQSRDFVKQQKNTQTDRT